MNECARELDEALVKRIIRPATVREPEFFQHIVRFVKKPLVEAFEIAKIMRVHVLPAAVFDQGEDFCAFFTHSIRVIVIVSKILLKLFSPHIQIATKSALSKEPVTNADQSTQIPVIVHPALMVSGWLISMSGTICLTCTTR